MAKEAYYFSHDSNARQDEKILMLRAEHSWEGYGIYWALIEMMFESSDTALHHNKIKGIAVSYNIDITLLQQVINTCITEELFASDNDKFWSESLSRRKSKFLDSKEKKSEAGKKGMAKRYGKQQSNNSVITEPNKVKESKVKESKENEREKKEEPKPSHNFLPLINKLNLKCKGIWESEKVEGYLLTMDVELIEEALKMSEHKKSVAYALGILADWEASGYKHLSDIKPKAGENSEKYQGSLRHEQSASEDKPITGGKTGILPSKWADKVIQMPNMSG